jgi:UDP-N-acetylglucosamine acyltransferase
VKIHPTAIVEDGAVLGADVEVGPYALIGPEAIIGAGCRILSHAVITSRVTLGQKNIVGHGAVIGAPPQDFAHNESMVSEVRIGSGNTFREHVTIHRGTKEGTATVVGDDNLVMVGAHFGHNVRVGNRTIVANNCLLGGYAEVADGAVLGGGTVFHQHMRVGRLAMVRGGTRFGKDIAPFIVADEDNVISGLNAIGLRRAGLSSDTRIELKRLFRHIFRSSMNVSQALGQLDETQWGAEAREMITFIREAKRGVCLTRPARRGSSADDEDGED